MNIEESLADKERDQVAYLKSRRDASQKQI